MCLLEMFTGSLPWPQPANAVYQLCMTDDGTTGTLLTLIHVILTLIHAILTLIHAIVTPL
jgi:hypothetical protein